MSNDVVYWLQERALRRYGATMNAAHTETQEWLWADEITRLREENARLREALKPFAEAFESDYAEQEEDHWDLWESAAASILTYGHLRAAKAAILGKVKAEAACPEPDEAP